MQKKVYRFVSYFLILLLLPLFTTFLFACSKKSDTPSIDNSTPVTPTPDKPAPEAPAPEVPAPEVPSPEAPSPDTPTTEIPDSPVFKEIVDYVKENGEFNNDYHLRIPTNKNSIYPDLKKDCYFLYNILGNFIYYVNLYYSDTNSASNNTFGFILKIPNLPDYTTHNFEFNYLKYRLPDRDSIASAKLTIPATIYNNKPTTLTLPEFQSFTTSGQDTTTDLSAFRSIFVDDINNAFAVLNTFFVETIKAGDTKYNNAIFKYFSLPVTLKV